MRLANLRFPGAVVVSIFIAFDIIVIVLVDTLCGNVCWPFHFSVPFAIAWNFDGNFNIRFFDPTIRYPVVCFICDHRQQIFAFLVMLTLWISLYRFIQNQLHLFEGQGNSNRTYIHKHKSQLREFKIKEKKSVRLQPECCRACVFEKGCCEIAWGVNERNLVDKSFYRSAYENRGITSFILLCQCVSMVLSDCYSRK